jgi:hypothetical protein
MAFERDKYGANFSTTKANGCISLNRSNDTDDRRRVTFRSSMGSTKHEGMHKLGMNLKATTLGLQNG